MQLYEESNKADFNFIRSIFTCFGHGTNTNYQFIMQFAPSKGYVFLVGKFKKRHNPHLLIGMGEKIIL